MTLYQVCPEKNSLEQSRFHFRSRKSPPIAKYVFLRRVTVGFARNDHIEGGGGRVGGRGGWRDDRDHGSGRGRFGDETGGRSSRHTDDRAGGGRSFYGDDRDGGIRGRHSDDRGNSFNRGHYNDRSDGNRWAGDRDQGSFFSHGGSYNRGGNRGSAGFGGDRDSNSYNGRGSNRRP